MAQRTYDKSRNGLQEPVNGKSNGKARLNGKANGKVALNGKTARNGKNNGNGKVRLDGNCKANGKARLNGKSNGNGNGRNSTRPPRPPARVPVPCVRCGICCTYVAIEVDPPNTLRRATETLWYLYHKNVSVYYDGDEWTLQFETPCLQQGPDNRCRIYQNRPHICRDLSARNCEINSQYEGEYFSTPEQFLDYLRNHRKKIYETLRQEGFTPGGSRREATAGRPGSFFRRFQQLRRAGIAPPGP
jgi:Fe-S-cluster containining protein